MLSGILCFSCIILCNIMLVIIIIILVFCQNYFASEQSIVIMDLPINKIHRILLDAGLPSTAEALKNPSEDYVVNLLTTFLSRFSVNMNLIDQVRFYAVHICVRTLNRLHHFSNFTANIGATCCNDIL